MVVDPTTILDSSNNNLVGEFSVNNTKMKSVIDKIEKCDDVSCFTSIKTVDDDTTDKINKNFNFKTLNDIKKHDIRSTFLNEVGQKTESFLTTNLVGDLRKETTKRSLPLWSPDKFGESILDFTDPLIPEKMIRSNHELDTSIREQDPQRIKRSSILNRAEKSPEDFPEEIKAFHEETQYLNLIREIIKTGSYEKSRNGNTYTKFGYTMRFSLKNGLIPLITTKKMAWKSCFEELFWFIRGSTSSVELQARGVNIWNGNGSREFLDSRGLYHLTEGDLGPIYGHQWRHFNAEYTNSKTCYQGEGIDQLKYIIDELSNPETRSSRRLIMTAWNPCQIYQMALPPCHMMAQFHVRENKYLSCALFQRSGDVGLGIPFNIASYSLLTHILAKHCGLESDEFVHFLGNCHIYEEHMEPLKTQIDREPFIFPRIEINKRDNIDDYCLDDIQWTTTYHSHAGIKMNMKA
jgi:thymidylate synthase